MLKVLIKIVMMLLWRWWCWLFGAMAFFYSLRVERCIVLLTIRFLFHNFVVMAAIVGVVTFGKSIP